jgi:hypothetical protein
MASLDKRMIDLEKTVTAHLIESGEIRADLKAVKEHAENTKDVPADIKWLRKMIWFVLGSPAIFQILGHFMSRGK